MLPLYKPRDFSTIFSDTFSFLKLNGKHFFRNYFLIMGLPLLILMIIYYFFFKYFINLSSGNVLDMTTPQIGYTMPGGIVAFMIILLIFVISAVVIGGLSFAYTPIYLALYNTYGTSFNKNDIWETIKARKKKIIKFTLMLVPLVFITGGIAVLISALLLISIVGILAIPLLIGYLVLSIHTAYMEYLTTESEYMDSITFGFQIIRQNFWKSVGNTTLFYIIIQIIIGLVTAIPYYIFIFTYTLSGEGMDLNSSFLTVTLIYYLVSAFLGMIMNVIVQINQGIIYYSLVEEKNNVSSYSDIDNIGK